MKKALAIIAAHVLLAVGCSVAIAAAFDFDDSASIRFTNLATNSYDSGIRECAEGWLESVTINPDAIGSDSFTGSVAITVLSTNFNTGASWETTVYSNDAIIATTAIAVRKPVNASNGTVTNPTTVLVRFPIVSSDRLKFYSKNVISVTNKNLSIYTLIVK